MEVMEEGNLMDRVPVLLERDLKYYQEHQSVLQEPICPGVVGGKLDFPRYASFASIKIVIWWEEEYFAAYRKHSGLLHTAIEPEVEDDAVAAVVKNSDPDKFVSLVTKSADLLMEHLHVLTQESLDHADLIVLTATLGAAALIKNCLKIYLAEATTKHYPPRGEDKGGSLKLSHKQFSQMAEALAERLLDLHTRLLLIYIIQDAECLKWEATEPFFESERGSYTIQMWWHYLSGIRDDLWNSVPPKMAKRIFAGILNDTLSVITVRYTHTVTSSARAQLHLVDICNLLFCISELFSYISESGESFIGLNTSNQSIITRDIHAKCRELFYCLLLRGAPLGVISKVFRKGVDDMKMFSSREGLPSAWIIFVLPSLFPKDHSSQWVTQFSELNTNTAIALELKVLLGYPAADWTYLVKVLLMREAKLSSIILPHLIKYLPSADNFKNAAKHSLVEPKKYENCGAFLCRKECFNAADLIVDEVDPVGQTNCQVVLSLTYILVAVGKASDIKTCLIAALEKSPPSWCDCLDKRLLWNQKRPPWLEAIMELVYPVLDCIVDMLMNSIETGSSMYQTMSVAITCVSEMWDLIPEGFYKVTVLLQDVISVSTKPLGDSVLFQIIFAALYTKLIKKAEEFESLMDDRKATICYSISEAICSIDEDDKHTAEIEMFLKQARESILDEVEFLFEDEQSDASTVKVDETRDRCSNSPPQSYPLELDVGSANYVAEILASDILIVSIGKQSLKVMYAYLKNNQDWLFEKLGVTDHEPSDFQAIRGQNLTEKKIPTLKSMFYIGKKPFDQLLTGSLKIDYSMWLQTSLQLNPERTKLHIERRCDFQDDAKLSIAEVAMVASIKKFLKTKMEEEEQQQQNV